jgi:hypothetical protein
MKPNINNNPPRVIQGFLGTSEMMYLETCGISVQSNSKDLVLKRNGRVNDWRPPRHFVKDNICDSDHKQGAGDFSIVFWS